MVNKSQKASLTLDNTWQLADNGWNINLMIQSYHVRPALNKDENYRIGLHLILSHVWI